MTRRWQWSGALLTAALASGLIVETAVAKVTFSGIGGAELGMTEGEVRDELGRASSQRRWTDRRSVMLEYRRRKLQVLIDRRADRVVGVKTTSRGQATASGLRVGSSERAVRSRLRDAQCSTIQGGRVCSVERNRRVLDFQCKRGRVVLISLSQTG